MISESLYTTFWSWEVGLNVQNNRKFSWKKNSRNNSHSIREAYKLRWDYFLAFISKFQNAVSFYTAVGHSLPRLLIVALKRQRNVQAKASLCGSLQETERQSLRVAQVGKKGYIEDGIIVQIATLQGSIVVDGLATYIERQPVPR